MKPSSNAAEIVGSQRPRIESRPRAVYEDAGQDAVDLAEAAGLVLDEWQRYVLLAMLAERYDRRWAAREVGLIVPRQQGKGSILEARELAGLFVFGERRIIHTAQNLKTSRDAFYRLKGLIDAVPELASQVKQCYEGNNENSIHLYGGQQIIFGVRSKNSGRGLSADLVVLDEAYDLTQMELAALMPTLTSSDNPQTIYTSSSGLPDSYVLDSVRERGIKGDKSLAFFEWSAEPDADPDDIEALIQANPGLGVRMSLDHVATERASMDDAEFKRERLGILPVVGEVDSTIPRADWDECRDSASEPGISMCFGVDLPPSRDLATVVAASVREDGLVHIEVIDEVGPELLAGSLAQLQANWSPDAIVIDEHNAIGSLAQGIRDAGVRLSPISFKDYTSACGLFLDYVRTHRIRHTAQEPLDVAVKTAVTTETAQAAAWKWKRTKGEVESISPLIAATLALHGALWAERRETRTVLTPSGRRVSVGRQSRTHRARRSTR